jgi:hypothetical protein
MVTHIVLKVKPPDAREKHGHFYTQNTSTYLHDVVVCLNGAVSRQDSDHVVSLHHAKVKTSTLREKVHTDAVYKKVS